MFAGLNVRCLGLFTKGLQGSDLILLGLTKPDRSWLRFGPDSPWVDQT